MLLTGIMVSPLDKYVIEKVRQIRLKKGMSQSQLAFELGVSNGVIGKIESGKYDKRYNISHVNKLAQIFECSPKDFFPKEPIIEK